MNVCTTGNFRVQLVLQSCTHTAVATGNVIFLFIALNQVVPFSFPCSADHDERDWPPCKVVFFGLATNTLNVRQQQVKVHSDFSLNSNNKLMCTTKNVTYLFMALKVYCCTRGNKHKRNHQKTSKITVPNFRALKNFRGF